MQLSQVDSLRWGLHKGLQQTLFYHHTQLSLIGGNTLRLVLLIGENQIFFHI